MKRTKPNFYVLCTLKSGIDVIELLKNDLKIKGIIGLTKRKSSDDISGYFYFRYFCKKNGLEFIPVNDYGLKNKNDQNRLLSYKIDILLVLGWQRLIPQWLIKHCKICALGVHGSSWGIVRGRGRSPQNWALILGKKKFSISIFRIDPEIDSGDVIDTNEFVLGEFDDIETSYFKSCMMTSKMIVKNIQNKKILKNKTNRQRGTPQYLPKRKPEDGEIDWCRSTKKIYNFIRALTLPYPGAFAKYHKSKIFVWKVRPFDIPKDLIKGKPGQILKIFHNGKFLVKTGDGALLVDDFSIEPHDSLTFLKKDIMLEHQNFKDQMKGIIKRHYERYPHNSINEEIHYLAK